MMKEHPDEVRIVGNVAWRCHGCRIPVSTRQVLQQRGERLLCAVCAEKADEK